MGDDIDSLRSPSESIYQVYPASFHDSNSDGHGDLKGITGRLDYIKNLNVDSVWISPFYLSPPGLEGDGGYAVTNYREIDPRYGDMDDFKELLREAHVRGLKIYIDFVIAHTANDHKWFEKSRRREEPYTDYYVWSDASEWHGHKAPPNNWKSVFGGPAWTWDNTRGQYYMHHFLKSQPKLNLNKKEVQDAALAEMKFWLDLGVDGFRIDALPFANHDPQLRNNPWLNGTWPNVREDWSNQKFEHSMCQPQTADFVARIRTLMDSYPVKKTTLGEVVAGPRGGGGSMEVASSYVDSAWGLDMCYTDATFAFNYYNDPAHLKNHIRYIEKMFPSGGHCFSISNHDSYRSASTLVGHLPAEQRMPALRQMMRVLSSLPGSISLYQGEELGLTQASIPHDIPHDRLRDPVSVTLGPHASRDGSRTPIPWHDEGKHAGFSHADEAYLPVPESHREKAVSIQERDPDSMLNFMRGLMAWRKNQPALMTGRTIVLDAPAPVLSFVRQCGEQTMLCAFNLAANAVTFKPADYLDNDVAAALSLGKDTVIALGPYEAVFPGGKVVGAKASVPQP